MYNRDDERHYLLAKLLAFLFLTALALLLIIAGLITLGCFLFG